VRQHDPVTVLQHGRDSLVSAARQRAGGPRDWSLYRQLSANHHPGARLANARLLRAARGGIFPRSFHFHSIDYAA
jgi:hypothetical protein